MFQVKVLELEQALQQERLKLGTLRKKHYELAELKEFDEQVKWILDFKVLKLWSTL